VQCKYMASSIAAEGALPVPSKQIQSSHPLFKLTTGEEGGNHAQTKVRQAFTSHVHPGDDA
jgi:hypothetical protein